MTLDVTPLVENNVDDLFDLLASDDFFDTFVELATATPTGVHDGHAPERLAAEELKAELVKRLATKVALSPMQALRAAGDLQKAGMARVMPVQREGGAA